MIFNNTEINWTGHSGFFIVAEKNIYIDPYKLGESEKADIILITHSHYDHCSIEDLMKIAKDGTVIVIPADCQSKISRIQKKIDLRILEPGTEITLGKIKIKAVPSYNTNKKFHNPHEYWNGYVLCLEKFCIYHAGDTDLIPEMSNLEGVDVALLPVSGVYTMNWQEAARAVLIIRPKLAIPMHYGEIVGTREDAERFCDLVKQEGFNCEVLEKK